MQEIRHDGSRGDIKPFVVEEMEKSLAKPEVKAVRVFKLRQGMKVNINDSYFMVLQINPAGNAVLKPIPKPKRPRHSVSGTCKKD